MNRRTALLCLPAALSAMTSADCITAEEVAGWQDDANRAWRSAQATQRPLVLYITMENCFYCRKMERETWSNRAVADDLRRQFVAANVHAETSAELVVKLKVRAYPTTIIISPTNGVVDHMTGYVPPQELQVRLAAAARRSAVPQSQQK